MYFLITNQLILLAEKSGTDNARARRVLEALDLAFRQGRHFVCAENSMLLERVIKLDVNVPGFKELRNNFSFYASVGKTYVWHAEFVSSEKKSSLQESTHTIFISLDGIDRFDIARETQILGENLSDVRFFQKILQYFKEKEGFKKSSSCAHPLLGGGRTTADVFEYECQNPLAFLICIVDSDYKFSGAALGDTANAIKQLCEKNVDNFFNAIFYHLIRAREIENLMTLSIIQSYSTKCPGAGITDKVNSLVSTKNLDGYIKFNN